MCTLSVVSTAPGHPRLLFNRDESVDRPVALPPRVHRIDGREVIFPIDPPSGGTWIAASDSGLVLALLNRNPTPPAASSTPDGPRSSREGQRSRGVIIPSLIASSGEDELARRVEDEILPADFPPFELVLLTRSVLRSWASDGTRLREVRHGSADELWLITSSGLGDELVDAPRRELFEATFDGPTEDWHQRQEEFHRHRWPDAPDVSVSMSRPDARTVSTTRVDVLPDRISMTYRSAEVDEPVRGLVVGRSDDTAPGSLAPCRSVAVPVRG